MGGVDLDKTFLNGKRKLADSLAGTLAVQIINSLEYIHSKGYTHNDVKAANLLLGLGADAKNIYLAAVGGHEGVGLGPALAVPGLIGVVSLGVGSVPHGLPGAVHVATVAGALAAVNHLLLGEAVQGAVG